MFQESRSKSVGRETGGVRSAITESEISTQSEACRKTATV